MLLQEYLGNFTVDGQKDIRMSQRNPSSNNTLTFLIIQDIAIENGKKMGYNKNNRNHNQYDLVFNDMGGTECAEVMELK